MPTFFQDEDYGTYLTLMKTWCARNQVAIWAYCLMPNHVHLIAVPETPDRLPRAIGEAHRRYTLHVDEREGWRGCLWQGRFGSFVMDEDYLLTAMRYVELNPVRAGLAAAPGDWPWSSARAHLTGEPDPLIGDVREMIDHVGGWERYLALDQVEAELLRLRSHSRTGRPLGSDAIRKSLEKRLGGFLRKRKTRPQRPTQEELRTSNKTRRCGAGVLACISGNAGETPALH